MAALLALLLFPGTVLAAGVESQPRLLRVEATEDGEIAVEARGVTVAAALRAIGAEVGFEVVIDEEVQRPLVDVEVSAAPIEDVLRQLLIGRNYALYSDSEDSAPTMVIVLPPSSRSSRAVSSRSRPGSRARRR
jgi:hypothetical protein